MSKMDRAWTSRRVDPQNLIENKDVPDRGALLLEHTLYGFIRGVETVELRSTRHNTSSSLAQPGV